MQYYGFIFDAGKMTIKKFVEVSLYVSRFQKIFIRYMHN